MTITPGGTQSVALRDMDALHLDEFRSIQNMTFELMSKCSEIERLLLVKGFGVKELIDQCVRKAVEVQNLLERAKTVSSSDLRNEAKYRRLAENFTRTSNKLEALMRQFSEVSNKPDFKQDTQLRVINEVSRSFAVSEPSTYRPPVGYEYISSMEEGLQGQTLHDLNRINKEMHSLQDIYYSLSETATSHQSSVLDSVQSKLSEVGHSASSAVKELTRAKDRMDYWTRVKVYTVTGLAAVGVLFWVI